MFDPVRLNLIVGWISMIAGATSGAAVGLFFHNENWMGGYASLRRRMIRLAHISFFGIGILNVLFALSIATIAIPPAYSRVASGGLIVAAITMPACCFLTAWRTACRHLFPIPVAGVVIGIAGLIGGLL